MTEKPAGALNTKQVAETQSDVSNLFELICRRAYEIYEQRGCTHGSDIDDWLQAEADVRVSLASRIPQKKS